MAEIEMESASVLPSISSLVSCSPTAAPAGAPSTGIAVGASVGGLAFLGFAFALFVLHKRKITSVSTGSAAGQCEAANSSAANPTPQELADRIGWAEELVEQENPVAVA